MPEPIVLTFHGKTPSKKNAYTPRRNGKGKGFFKDAKLQASLDALAWQLPDEYRDINLRNPDVNYQFYLPPDSKHSRSWSQDADSKVTAIQDILVQMGVFKDDCFRHHNGRKVIEPAIESDEEKVVITIQPR